MLVHGLNGHPIKTWKRRKGFWPKDLLPTDYPEARIWSFGYDADFVSQKSFAQFSKIDILGLVLTASVDKDLLDHGSSEQRLIFICHSFGGLVVKSVRVLQFCRIEEELKSL